MGHPKQLDADSALAAVAARQHGVILRADAIAAGLSGSATARRVRKGVLRRLHDGVYAVAAVPPTTRQTLFAAVRWAGPGSAASHRAAAHLWQLDGFSDPALEVSGPRRMRSRTVSSHITPPIPIEDMSTIDGIPVTSIERTLFDLAGVVDVDALEDALDSALRRPLTTMGRLKLRLRSEKGRTGVGRLRALLHERDADGHPSESRFETRLNRLLLRSGLPAARQFTIWDGGVFVARVDFCFPEARLVVEADSYRWHGNRRAWQRDIERRNQMTALGWQIIQVTWADLTRNPDRIVGRLRDLLQPRLIADLPS
jgi:very-short-patch-repair endonuclease